MRILCIRSFRKRGGYCMKKLTKKARKSALTVEKYGCDNCECDCIWIYCNDNSAHGNARYSVLKG